VVDGGGKIRAPEEEEALVEDLVKPRHVVLGEGSGVKNDGEGAVCGRKVTKHVANLPTALPPIGGRPGDAVHVGGHVTAESVDAGVLSLA